MSSEVETPQRRLFQPLQVFRQDIRCRRRVPVGDPPGGVSALELFPKAPGRCGIRPGALPPLQLVRHPLKAPKHQRERQRTGQGIRCRPRIQRSVKAKSQWQDQQGNQKEVLPGKGGQDPLMHVSRAGEVVHRQGLYPVDTHCKQKYPHIALCALQIESTGLRRCRRC